MSKITEQHLDWLPIMDLVLSRFKESFNSNWKADWKALRRSNKAIKQLIDPIVFKKFKLNIHRLGETEYKAIAASPILQHVKELEIYVKEEHEVEVSDADDYYMGATSFFRAF